ncbi:MAG: sulfite exporter TauE/SafE family protein [Clostridia bacterium]|nr:sulfite exporter TauE/SafE family protein [Clostridia bacterium]
MKVFNKKLIILAIFEQNNIMLKRNNIKNLLLQIGLGSIIGFINGFFGGGAGMIIVPSLIHFFKLEDKKAHATSLVIVFPLCVISSIIYLINSQQNMDFGICIKVGIGFVIGGITGALLLKKIDNKVLRIIFSLVMVICGIIQIIK